MREGAGKGWRTGSPANGGVLGSWGELVWAERYLCTLLPLQTHTYAHTHFTHTYSRPDLQQSDYSKQVERIRDQLESSCTLQY